MYTLYDTIINMTKTQKIIYYVLLILISLGFISGGIPKITADPQAVTGFAQAHLPLWFLYFIGYAEIIGAIGLWIRKTSLYAIIGLWTILAGAVVVTAVFMSPVYSLIPLVYAVVLGIIFWLGKKRV